MSNVATLKTAADFRRENNALREMLRDTASLLASIKAGEVVPGRLINGDNDIQLQIEAINEVLTDGSKPD